jgi:uncharacterized membrane protein YbaN (DUF454 family)
MNCQRRSQPADSPSSDNQLLAHKRLAESILFKEVANLRHDGGAPCSKKCKAVALAVISIAITCM